VHELLARELIAQALKRNPDSRILAIYAGEDRKLGSSAYQVDLCNPGGLRLAVAGVLAQRVNAQKTT
jgi:hypothetical protein